MYMTLLDVVLKTHGGGSKARLSTYVLYVVVRSMKVFGMFFDCFTAWLLAKTASLAHAEMGGQLRRSKWQHGGIFLINVQK